MIETSAIREHMEVIGADGVHVGTVDKLDGDRIKLTKQDSGAQVEGGTGSHEGHHHYISVGLVADIEGEQVRLSATAANAANFTQEEGEGQTEIEGGNRVPVMGQDIDEDEMIPTAGTEKWGGGERAEVAPDGQDNQAGENRGFGQEAGR